MPRIRTIKPEYFKNDNLACLDPLTRLLFIGLWTLCDREGKVEDRPKRIKAELLPYDDVDIEAALSSLAGTFIHRYTVGEKHIIKVLNFNKHQIINVKEQPSTLPEPTEHSTSTVQAQCQGSTSTEGALQEGKGKEGKGKEGKGGEGESGENSFRPHAQTSTFDERKEKFMMEVATFIDVYPKKMLREFFEYWAEPNKSKTKFKRELEKTWDLGRRLRTWADREKITTHGAQKPYATSLEQLVAITTDKETD